MASMERMGSVKPKVRCKDLSAGAGSPLNTVTSGCHCTPSLRYDVQFLNGTGSITQLGVFKSQIRGGLRISSRSSRSMVERPIPKTDKRINVTPV